MSCRRLTGATPLFYSCIALPINPKEQNKATLFIPWDKRTECRANCT